MPEQFNLPLQQPAPSIETPPPIETPAEDTDRANQAEFDFVLKDLYHQPLDEALKNPLSDAFRKFRENNIIGRLNMIDADMTEDQRINGQKTYREMFERLTPANQAIVKSFITPTAIKGFISKSYASLKRKGLA